MRRCWLKPLRAWSLRGPRVGFVGGDHAFLSWIDEMIGIGALVRRDREAATAQEVTSQRSPEQIYREICREICSVLVASGASLEPLRSYLLEPPSQYATALTGVTLDSNGELDLARLFANVSTQEARARAHAFDTVGAFIAYALFTAKNVLEPDASDASEARIRDLREGLR